MSRDGSVIVGDRTVWLEVFQGILLHERDVPFLWSESRGAHPFPWESSASFTVTVVTAMNPDAGIFAGVMEDDKGERFPFRSNGAVLEILPDPEGGFASPRAMTPDGNVVAGYLEIPASYATRAVRWDRTGQSFYPKVDGFDDCGPARLSADGRVTVGSCAKVDESHAASSVQSVAVRWEEDRAEVLPRLPGETLSAATHVSSDGSVIVGELLIGEEYTIFVWTAREGKRLLKDLLAEAGQGESIKGWQLRVPAGVSDDGRVIAGTGQDQTGRLRAFRAVLP